MENDKMYQTVNIFENHTRDTAPCYPIYSDAYKEAIKAMQDNKEIVSVLIYSNKQTAIIVKRKHVGL